MFHGILEEKYLKLLNYNEFILMVLVRRIVEQASWVAQRDVSRILCCRFSEVLETFSQCAKNAERH